MTECVGSEGGEREREGRVGVKGGQKKREGKDVQQEKKGLVYLFLSSLKTPTVSSQTLFKSPQPARPAAPQQDRRQKKNFRG